MEQELRFGLDLGQLAVLKKRVLVDYEQFFDSSFFMCSGAKTNVIIFLKNIIVSVDNEVKKNIFFLKRLRFFEIYIYI